MKMMTEALEAEANLKLKVKMTCTPYHARFMLERGVSGGRGCMAGAGYVFVSHVGDVQGCGFLPTPAGNIREKTLKEIYLSSKLFRRLRDRDRLGGACGACEFRWVCGGCRARAYSASGDPTAEDPVCPWKKKAS